MCDVPGSCGNTFTTSECVVFFSRVVVNFRMKITYVVSLLKREGYRSLFFYWLMMKFTYELKGMNMCWCVGVCVCMRVKSCICSFVFSLSLF